MAKSRVFTSAALAGVLVVAGLAAGPAFAEDPPLVWTMMPDFPVTAGEVTVEFESALSTTPFGTQETIDAVPVYRPDITNGSMDTKYFGFGSDFVMPGTIDPLWTAAAWGAFADVVDDGGVVDLFWIELPSGASLSTGGTAGSAGTWYDGMPSWSGHTITVFELSAAPVAGVTPSAMPLASVTTPGRFVGAHLSDGNVDNLSALLGQRATVYSGVSGPPELFAGLTSTVLASGLTPDDVLELWIARDFNYAYFQILGGGLPVGAMKVGEGTVADDGTLTATFTVPTDLGWNAGETAVPYQLVAGIRGERYWPAGTYDDFVVKLAPNQASEPSDAGASQVILDLAPTPVGSTQVQVTYPDGTTAGTTTAIVSPTGPLPDGFTVATDPPLYLHLDTTAVLGGLALVCIAYDTGAVTGEPRLFHFDPDLDAWVDITTSSEPGIVCGETASFSPFVLGYPDEFDFSGFFAPVSMDADNIAQPGQAIPVKFSLNGDQGLEIVESARFVIEGTDTTPEGELIPATTAAGSGLTYNAADDIYTYVWKTSKSFSLKTGHFELTLSDGTVHTFDVTFKK
jgi:hypothetical protein